MINIREEKLWKYDSHNGGALCRMLLDRHRLRQADLAIDPKLDANKVSRYVNNNDGTLDTISAIVRNIAEDGEPGLSPSRRRKLLEMITHSSGDALVSLEEELATLSLDYLRARNRSGELQRIVEQLRRERRPAFIVDDLWFVHAYNGASLRLFGVDYNGRDKDKLRNWQAWHVIATKFTPGSIIRDAHIDPNAYFRPAVEKFFNDINIYLFTAQVRLLLKRIYDLSAQRNLGFEHMWLDAVTFRGNEFPLENLRRTLRHPNNPSVFLDARTLDAFGRPVQIVPPLKYTTKYTLVFWDPDGADAKQFFNRIGNQDQDILFAADFEDANNPFHVNKWPETLEHFDTVGIVH